MIERLVLQFLTLSIFSFLMGITFCDFYKIKTPIKIIWFLVLLAISIYVMRTYGEFKLELILPVPMLLAIRLAWRQKKRIAKSLLKGEKNG